MRNYSTTPSILVFLSKGMHFAIEMQHVENMLETPPIAHIFNAPNYIKGLISIKNNTIPVWDIQEKLNLSSNKDTTGSSVVLVNSKQNLSGILADEIIGIYRYNEKQTLPFPQNQLFPLSFIIKSLIKVNGKLVMLINPEELFSYKQKKTLCKQHKAENLFFVDSAKLLDYNDIHSGQKPNTHKNESVFYPTIKPKIKQIRGIPKKKIDKKPIKNGEVSMSYGLIIKNVPGAIFKN